MNIEITDKEVKLLNLMILSYWIENNNTHEDNCEDWISTENLVKKLSQHDVSGRFYSDDEIQKIKDKAYKDGYDFGYKFSE